MIAMQFFNCNWGVDGVEGGAQINMLDPKAEIVAQLPFTGDSLPKLIELLAEHITEDQKRELMPTFSGGLHLPGRDFPADGKGVERGPQG